MKSDAAAPAGPDPTKPVDLKMMRTASLTLDQNDAAKVLVVGRAMANGGNVDGEVVRLQRHPDGAVIATVRKRRRSGNGEVTATDRYTIVQGDLEGEVMSEAERRERGFETCTFLDRVRRLVMGNPGCSWVRLNPEDFETLHRQAVAERDPALAAEWVGDNRDHLVLKLPVLGRAVQVSVRPDLQPGEVEFDDEAKAAAE